MVTKTPQVEEFKIQSSGLLEGVSQGETIEIVYGKNKKPIAPLTPIEKAKERKGKRKIGILEGKASYVIRDDFKMTEEEFINLGR